MSALGDHEAPAERALQSQITLSLRSKIRSLCPITLWPFRRIAASVCIPLSTVFSICAQPGTSYPFGFQAIVIIF